MVVYRDEYNATTGVITRNVGVKVLDIGGVSGIGFCTHFKHQFLNQPGYFYFKSSTPHNLYIVLGQSYDLTNFKAYLASQYNAGTPVIVVYPTSSPTAETVPGQPLTTQAGTNIVSITQASIDNLELEVSYKAGVTVTITEVQNSQLSNQVTVTIGG